MGKEKKNSLFVVFILSILALNLTLSKIILYPRVYLYKDYLAKTEKPQPMESDNICLHYKLQHNTLA